jgi:uncharacterized membrane protein YhhN
MTPVLMILLALPLLAGLLWAERGENQRGMLLTKPFLSALFVAALFAQPYQPAPYFFFLLAGLILCWIGDVSLVFFFDKRLFLLGLASFLLGHVMYAIAFFARGGLHLTTWLALPLIAAFSGYVFTRFRPHLGEMRAPVTAYIVVISLMLLGAAGLAGNASLPLPNRLMTVSGAFSFYISDIFVARQRFVRPAYINRLLGLALYYLGQFLIALAAGGLSA